MKQRSSCSIEYMQCPEFSTTPAVFISGTTSTEVNKGTLLSEVSLATVRTCKSNGQWSAGGGRGVPMVKRSFVYFS